MYNSFLISKQNIKRMLCRYCFSKHYFTVTAFLFFQLLQSRLRLRLHLRPRSRVWACLSLLEQSSYSKPSLSLDKTRIGLIPDPALPRLPSSPPFLQRSPQVALSLHRPPQSADLLSLWMLLLLILTRHWSKCWMPLFLPLPPPPQPPPLGSLFV